MTESTLDQVLAELNDLQRRMSELPDDAFAERVMVRERRRELHAQAAELRGASRSLEGLQKELQDLRRLRDEVFDRHLSIGNIGAGGGEGGGGVEVRYVNEVNRTIDEAGALSRINRQIRELEVELGRRLQSGEGS